MSRTMWVIVALCALWPSRAGAEGGQVVEIRARGQWPHLPLHIPGPTGTDREPQRLVIRSPEELVRAAGGKHALDTISAALKVPPIDFTKHMIVAVADGAQPLVGTSGGGPPSALYAVSITRISFADKDKTVVVFWRRVPRGKNQGVLSRPLEAVLVDRFDGDVSFAQLPSPDQPSKESPAGKELVPVARAFWPDGWPPEATPQHWFVRDYQALIDPRLRAPEPVLERMRQEANTRYVKALKVPHIDFTKQMVIGVSGGVQPSGTLIEITLVELDAAGQTMTVRWRLRPSAPAATSRALTHPAEVVLVSRFTGEVRFQEEPTKKE